MDDKVLATTKVHSPSVLLSRQLTKGFFTSSDKL
jgi:hypothetical protein